MHRQTGNIHAILSVMSQPNIHDVLSVMPQPMREGYAYWNVTTTTKGCLLTHLENIKHPENGPGTHLTEYISQIDYIVVQKRFQSGINRAKTRMFTRADI